MKVIGEKAKGLLIGSCFLLGFANLLCIVMYIMLLVEGGYERYFSLFILIIITLPFLIYYIYEYIVIPENIIVYNSDANSVYIYPKKGQVVVANILDIDIVNQKRYHSRGYYYKSGELQFLIKDNERVKAKFVKNVNDVRVVLENLKKDCKENYI